MNRRAEQITYPTTRRCSQLFHLQLQLQLQLFCQPWAINYQDRQCPQHLKPAPALSNDQVPAASTGPSTLLVCASSPQTVTGAIHALGR